MDVYHERKGTKFAYPTRLKRFMHVDTTQIRATLTISEFVAIPFCIFPLKLPRDQKAECPKEEKPRLSLDILKHLLYAVLTTTIQLIIYERHQPMTGSALPHG
jgi:hypothetical protein